VDACNPLLQAHLTWARDEHEGRGISTSLTLVSGRLASPLRARPRARPIWAGARGTLTRRLRDPPSLETPTDRVLRMQGEGPLQGQLSNYGRTQKGEEQRQGANKCQNLG
jgi:hypothetical protein